MTIRNISIQFWVFFLPRYSERDHRIELCKIPKNKNEKILSEILKTASWEHLPPLRDSYQDAERDRVEEKAGLKFPTLSTNENACHIKTTNDWVNLKMINFQSIFLRLTSKKSTSWASQDNIRVFNIKNHRQLSVNYFPPLVR